MRVELRLQLEVMDLLQLLLELVVGVADQIDVGVAVVGPKVH